MGLTNYVSAMDCWKGRIDSTTDYDAFRWHQWVQPLDLNIQTEKPECGLGFAFIGFCSEQGVKRNKGRVGTALAPDFIRAQMSNLPCTFLQDVKLYDAGNILCDATIINKKLLYGNKSAKYSLIGLSSDKKLVLGKYTYKQAMNVGIESAVEFGPFLIVNGKNQITNSSSGGIHPRMAIGQKKDGTFIFVVVDGRQPGYSIGTNLLELQNIFNRTLTP